MFRQTFFYNYALGICILRGGLYNHISNGCEEQLDSEQFVDRVVKCCPMWDLNPKHLERREGRDRAPN